MTTAPQDRSKPYDPSDIARQSKAVMKTGRQAIEAVRRAAEARRKKLDEEAARAAADEPAS